MLALPPGRVSEVAVPSGQGLLYRGSSAGADARATLTSRCGRDLMGQLELDVPDHEYPLEAQRTAQLAPPRGGLPLYLIRPPARPPVAAQGHAGPPPLARYSPRRPRRQRLDPSSVGCPRTDFSPRPPTPPTTSRSTDFRAKALLRPTRHFGWASLFTSLPRPFH